VPERAQAVAAVGPGPVAADGIAQRGPRGVGACRCRPVAQDAGEKVRLADGLPVAETVGGALGEGGELFEGLTQIPMASSVHGAGNPRFPGRLDRHDRARE
jgi:hypothetical protein